MLSMPVRFRGSRFADARFKEPPRDPKKAEQFEYYTETDSRIYMAVLKLLTGTDFEFICCVCHPSPNTPFLISHNNNNNNNNNTATMIGNLQTFGNPALLLASKVVLSFTALLLVNGRSGLAACLAPLSVFFLQATTKGTTTKNAEKWMILSFTASLANIASCLSLLLAKEVDNIQAYKLWIVGAGLQKGCAGVLLYYLYRDSKSAPPEPEDAIHFLEIRVWVKEGRNLVAKDTNIFGRPTTSDPYVKVYHGPNKLGKTAIIKKTLDPVWDNEIFCIPVVPRVLDVYRNIECSIFDHDNLSSDDPMGTVYIPIPRNINDKVAEWHRVERGEGTSFCKDAQGELCVEVEIRSQLNKSFKNQLFKQASQRNVTLDPTSSKSLNSYSRGLKSSARASTKKF
jgi:hypothetical protein